MPDCSKRSYCIILLVFTLSMICMGQGQTFQYSRGWTNGKRSPTSDEDNRLSDILEIRRDEERKFEKCLLQLQHFLRNPLVLRSGPFRGALSLSGNRNPLLAGANNANYNNNNLFPNHPSSELLEELGAAEVSDYPKH